MKRTIALVLSLLMIIGLLPNKIVYAANELKLYSLATKLIETTNGISTSTQMNKDAEEATMQWNVAEGGLYELTYYTEEITENQGDTSKVIITLRVGEGYKEGEPISDSNIISKPNAMILKTEVFNSKGAKLDNIDYQQHLFGYTGVYGTIQKGTFIAEMGRPVINVAQSTKELSLVVGKSLKILIKGEDNTIKVWTNGISKGNITDFTLKHGADSDVAIVFRGLSDVSITPTQLQVDGTLDTKKEIYSPGEITGEKPGVKVEFERPKKRNSKGIFEAISEAEGSKLKVTLDLYTVLEPNDKNKENEVLLNFTLGGSATNIIPTAGDVLTGNIITDGGNPNKYATLLGDKVAVYLAQKDSYVSDGIEKHVVTWETLKESMLIGGTIRLEGDIKAEGMSSTVKINTGDISLKTGYTYLKFIPIQSKVGETSLDIDPYKYTGEITYKVYKRAGAGEINEATDLQGSYPYTYDPEYPDEILSISIPSREEATFLIKAIISEDNPFVSQHLIYNPQGENVVIKPSIPQIRDVNNIYVIPEINQAKGLESAGFDITWSAPAKEDLLGSLVEKGADGKEYKKGDLYYELYLYNAQRTVKSLLGIVHIEYDIDKKKIVGYLYQGEDRIPVEYDDTDKLFIAKKVKLKDMKNDWWVNLELNASVNKSYNYPSLDVISQKDGLAYSVPGVYYLSMKPIIDSVSPNKRLNEGDESQVYSLTLDITTEVVPVPHEIKGENTTSTNTAGHKVEFNNVSIERFYQMMLEPGNWELVSGLGNVKLPGTYEIYLYQEAYISNSGKKENKQTDTELLLLIEEMQNETVVSNLKDKKVINFEPDTPIGTITEDNNKVSGKDSLIAEGNISVIDALREGKIIKIDYSYNPLDGSNGTDNTDKKPTLELKDLDPNQTYHIRIRVRLDKQRLDKNDVLQSGLEYADYSLFSKAYGFTVTTEPKPPTEDEDMPPAPKDYTGKSEDNTSAILNWKDPDFTPKENDWSKVSYEIIRVTDTKLTSSIISSIGLNLNEVIGKANRKDLITFGKDDYKKISKEEQDGTQIVYELIDDTLRPNTIYYYYVRTSYNGKYSEWVMQPITTKNIEKPIDLQTITTDKTTTTISFLAKAPLGDVPNLYDFEIAIQSEEQTDWGIVTEINKVLLKQTHDNAPEGYTYYEYKITGLKPGKRYNIKVCMLDKTKEMIAGSYQKSLYSNIIYIRTEYDEAEQEKDNKFEEYLKRFDTEVEKLRRRPYWVVEEGKSYKYRESYLTTELGSQKEYQLVAPEGTTSLYYYMPAAAMVAGENSNTIIKVVLGNQVLNIRPYTLTIENESIKSTVAKINDKEIEDYYVAIEFYTQKYTDGINGQNPLTPKININLELVYMKQKDGLTEDDIMVSLNEIADNEKKGFITELEKVIYKGTVAEDVLNELITDVIQDIEASHSKKVDKIMHNQTKKVVTISKLDKSILLMSNVDAFIAEAYYYKGGWLNVESYQVSTGFGIEVNQLGGYILTGKADLITTVPTLAPYQSFISKYNLTDFFTLDRYMIKTAVTKAQLYGATARILGAKRGTDYIVFLKNKGIKGVTSIGGSKNIRQDELIYIVMQAYEKLYNRPIASTIVKNRQAVQNIGAFQTIYRDYVYVAVELKIITPVDSKVFPSQNLTIEEAIKILYKLQKN